MPKYHVCTIRPPGNQFPLCFREMSALIQYGLQELGHDCTQSDNSLHHDRTNIIFGYHEWWKPVHPLTAIRDYDCILYQAEQLQPGGRQMPDWYFTALRSRPVWDYSLDNIKLCRLNGMNPAHVPPCWSELYQPIDIHEEKSTDVLFMGALNGRREYMLKLIGTMASVHGMCGVWGIERDDHMAGCRMLLNIHYYQSQTLELLRLTHAMNSGIPVVSEVSENNPYGEAIAMCPYHELPATVIRLLHNPGELIALGVYGREEFRKTSMAETINQALSNNTEPAGDSGTGSVEPSLATTAPTVATANNPPLDPPVA